MIDGLKDRWGDLWAVEPTSADARPDRSYSWGGAPDMDANITTAHNGAAASVPSLIRSTIIAMSPPSIRTAVIVDVEATRSIRTAEVGASQTMVDRIEEGFGIKSDWLVADTA